MPAQGYAYGAPQQYPGEHPQGPATPYNPQAYPPHVTVAPNINVVASPTMNQSVAIGGRVKRTNHLLHFVLTLLTGGLWLFVWIPLALSRRRQYG